MSRANGYTDDTNGIIVTKNLNTNLQESDTSTSFISDNEMCELDEIDEIDELDELDNQFNELINKTQMSIKTKSIENYKQKYDKNTKKNDNLVKPKNKHATYNKTLKKKNPANISKSKVQVCLSDNDKIKKRNSTEHNNFNFDDFCDLYCENMNFVKNFEINNHERLFYKSFYRVISDTEKSINKNFDSIKDIIDYSTRNNKLLCESNIIIDMVILDFLLL